MSAAQKKAELDRWMKSSNGRFVVAGVVVDEQGNKLQGIRLTIEKGKATGAWEDLKTEEEEKTVDGEFALKYDGYASLTLQFRRDGYYTRVLDFGFSPLGVDEDQFAGRKEIPTPSLVNEKLKVVLEKQGNVVILEERDGLLECTGKGPKVVCDFDRRASKRPFVSVEGGPGTNQLPKNCAYILADADPKGMPATLTVKRKERKGPNPEFEYEYVYPRKLRLVMSFPGGGFAKCDVRTTEDGKVPYHQMKTAPESGYDRELVLDEFFFASLRSDDAGQYFYFKTKDKYGKGQVCAGYDQATKVVRAGVTFRLQPDGSRNVETAEYNLPMTIKAEARNGKE